MADCGQIHFERRFAGPEGSAFELAEAPGSGDGEGATQGRVQKPDFGHAFLKVSLAAPEEVGERVVIHDFDSQERDARGRGRQIELRAKPAQVLAGDSFFGEIRVRLREFMTGDGLLHLAREKVDSGLNLREAGVGRQIRRVSGCDRSVRGVDGEADGARLVDDPAAVRFAGGKPPGEAGERETDGLPRRGFPLPRELAHRIFGDAVVAKQLSGEAFLFAKQTEEEMVGADLFLAQEFAFRGAVSHGSPGFVTQRDVDGSGDFRVFITVVRDSGAKSFDPGVRTEQMVCQRLILAEQAEEEMFRFGSGAAELAGLIAGEEDSSPCRFAETLEHTRTLPQRERLELFARASGVLLDAVCQNTITTRPRRIARTRLRRRTAPILIDPILTKRSVPRAPHSIRSRRTTIPVRRMRSPKRLSSRPKGRGHSDYESTNRRDSSERNACVYRGAGEEVPACGDGSRAGGARKCEYREG